MEELVKNKMNEEIEKKDQSLFRRHWFLIIVTLLMVCDVVAFLVEEKTSHISYSVVYEVRDSLRKVYNLPDESDVLKHFMHSADGSVLYRLDGKPLDNALIDSTINTISRLNGNGAAMRECLQKNMVNYQRTIDETKAEGLEDYRNFIWRVYDDSTLLRPIDSLAFALMLPKLEEEYGKSRN